MSTTNDAAAKANLAEAARQLRRHGHTKNWLRKSPGFNAPGPEGAYCVVGAMNVARHGHHSWKSGDYPMPEARLLADYLGLEYDPTNTLGIGGSNSAIGACVQWNNAPERTPCEVILACEAAAGVEPKPEPESNPTNPKATTHA